MCNKETGCKKHNSNSGSLLLGVVVGVALGMLFAPESGEETRKKIKSKTKNLPKALDEIDIVLKQISKTAKPQKEKVVSLLQEVTSSEKKAQKKKVKPKKKSIQFKGTKK